LEINQNKNSESNWMVKTQ